MPNAQDNQTVAVAADETAVTNSNPTTNENAPVKKSVPKYSKPDKGTLFFPAYGPRITGTFHDCYQHASAGLIANGIEAGGVVGIELEVGFENDEDRETFTDMKTNIMQYTSDSSIESDYPMEIQTCPLKQHDVTNPKFWEPIIAALNLYDAKSWKNPSTGMHVHLSRRLFSGLERNNPDYTPNNRSFVIQAAKALYALYVEDATWKKALFGRTTSNYCSHKCGGEILKAITKILPAALRSKPCVVELIKEVSQEMSEKYIEFNTQHSNTVEFRVPKASLNARRIAAVCEFFLIFAQYCSIFNDKIHLTSKEQFDKFIKTHMKKSSCIKDYIFSDEA